MYKLQIACLIIMLFITTIYFSVKRVNTLSYKLFSASLLVTIFNLFFDIITVYTVNHLDTVAPRVNDFCHKIFIGSMIMEIAICYGYCNTLICGDEEERHKISVWAVAPVMIAWICLAVLPIEYKLDTVTNYSWGPAVFCVFAILILYVLFTMGKLIVNWNKMNPKKRNVVALAYAIQIAVFAFQATIRTSLISSLALILVNLSFFLTVESPDVLLIEQLHEEKERADKANIAKTRFLSNMSHEIRTPMNAIVGLTEVLLREDLGEKENQYLYYIKSSGDSLLALINDLLDFSKLEAGKFTISEEDYEPLCMVEDMKPIFKERIGNKDLTMQYEIDAALPSVLHGDSVRIHQIIINLVNNAIKYSEKGTVTLSIQAKEFVQDKVKLLVSVRDTGIGIREEDQEKLFDAFEQVDIRKNKTQEGTGLGLAICKQLVELMGGHIYVTSEYGKGSNFYFVLMQRIVSHMTVGEKQTLATPKRQYHAKSDFGFTLPEDKVLLVDDNEINRIVVKSLLEPLKLQITEAVNGMEALEMVQCQEYHLILMDHYMPVMDGIEAAKRIRALEGNYYKHVPILALTADAVAEERRQFYEAGMDDIVSKPISVEELIGKIRYFLVEADNPT